MAFRDVKLPDHIERDFSGGPVFDVSIVTTASQFEQRNLNSSRPRIKQSASLPYGLKSEHDELLAFWLGVRGTLDSFRFRDWSNYYVGKKWGLNGSSQEVLLETDGDSNPVLPELIGTSSGSTATIYQLKKAHSFGSLTYDQIITKPVSGAKIWVETSSGSGVFNERTTNFTLNLLTGQLQFTSSAPSSGLKVAWSGEFDIPVRFSNSDPGFATSFVGNGSMRFEVIEVFE